MPWAKRITKSIPSRTNRRASVEMNDYSLGFDSFISNDKMPVKDGSTNIWRLAQDARVSTLGEYDTRKGFDFHSDPAGVTLDQSQVSITGASNASLSETAWLAQKFTAGTSGRLSRIDVNLKNAAGATGTILIELWTDSSSAPGTLLARSSVPASDLTSSYAYQTVRFVQAPTVTATTVYWIVARVQSVGSGSYSWSSTTNATTAKTSINSGVSWSSTSYSLNFRQYYATDGAPKGLFRGYKSDGTKVTLMAHGTSLYKVNDVTGALTAIKTGLSASATDYRFVLVNDIIYYVNGYDGLRKWDFTTESQVNATNYTLIAVHKGLLCLVKKDDPQTVVYSNFGIYETFTSTDFITVPAPKTGDPVTALVSLNGYLIIPTLNNKFILSGDDNATFSLDEAPDQNGTYRQETITKDDNFIYYLSNTGVYRSNGSEPQLMSESAYTNIMNITNKAGAVLCVNRGRLYLWYASAGSGFNNCCYVWNLKYGSGSRETLESHDTNAFVSRAVTAFNDDHGLLVASSLIGQAYWQEKASNDYTNLGGDIQWLLEKHYMTLGTPSTTKHMRRWYPRFRGQSSSYTVDCEYAYDLRNNWQTHSQPSVQGSGAIWGTAIWGAFTWGTTAEVAPNLYIPGAYRRTAIRYKHYATRQPNTFLGHSFEAEIRQPL